MALHDNIQYLRQDEINKQLWDQCIGKASNGLLYAYSYYLDCMADHWDGLVLGNYEAVMPLPWRKKYGIHYLYQPFLTAQLGLFGNAINTDLLKKFLDTIPAKFRLWEFSLNHENFFDVAGYDLRQRKNYVLDLNRPYKEISGAYRENIKRNIRKSVQYGCSVRKMIPFEEVEELVKQQNPSISHTDLVHFSNLYHYLRTKQQAATYGIVSAQGELVASCVFLFSHNRSYYILVGNHPNGRTLGASHALIDAFVKDHAERDLLLDFEGSDLRNLAFFYSSFGAKEENYPAIRLNRLPWYARWLKK